MCSAFFQHFPQAPAKEAKEKYQEAMYLGNHGRHLSCTTWVLDGSWKSQMFAIELSVALSSGAI